MACFVRFLRRLSVRELGVCGVCSWRSQILQLKGGKRQVSMLSMLLRRSKARPAVVAHSYTNSFWKERGFELTNVQSSLRKAICRHSANSLGAEGFGILQLGYVTHTGPPLAFNKMNLRERSQFPEWLAVTLNERADLKQLNEIWFPAIFIAPEWALSLHECGVMFHPERRPLRLRQIMHSVIICNQA